MSAIIVKDLVKRYGRFTAVQDVSFEVAAGQVTALLGPNGAGKTTTIEILEGFLAPTAGTVQVLGANPRSGGRAWRARIGLVLQSSPGRKMAQAGSLLAADRPVACLQGLEQQTSLGGPDVEFRDADREAR
jgi:ABC-2 type transport system ATP-binding protein